MADQEHLDILKQGAEVWNRWVKEHENIIPDLGGADLSDTDLSGTDLSEANLGETDLRYANLSGANLSEAGLLFANLMDADLTGGNFSHTNFLFTNLEGANLEGANLSEAILVRANLTGADLTEADLTGAIIDETIFGNVDLSTVKGLDTIVHVGPSTIGINTIYNSKGDIPEVFLKGAGIDDTFISYIRSLVGKPIEYYSCFISYSSKDKAFARQLRADLLNNNVRCWFAPEDLKWGERTRTGIDKAIGLHDKLLLILSKYSIASGWVEHEVRTALEKERKEKRVVLFPVRVDKAVLESPLSWATEIRHERNIGDFTRWKDPDEYQKGLGRLLRDLKASS